MILQALNEYYLRKTADADPARRLPAFGLEEKEIPFIIELTRAGEPVAIKDTRTPQGKKLVATRFLVPKGLKRASGVAANLLWDTAEYALGVDSRGKPERVAQQHAAFGQRIEDLPGDLKADAGVSAVREFLAHATSDRLRNQPLWEEIRTTNPLIAFRLVDDTDLICQRPAVVRQATATVDTEINGRLSVCLVTGERTHPERLHSAIKGVWGAQTAGANIVSFNLDAFTSFGKAQGANSPVSPAAAFAYTTALNHLLAKHSRQRLQVGDASTVFWAAKADRFEDVFASFFGETDNPDDTEDARAVLAAVDRDGFDGGRGENQFYVLGLAPNAARISVRFWHAAPLWEIADRIRAWFADIEMTCGPNDPAQPSLFRLLTACAVQGKSENVPPNLGGEIMRAILNGGPFPALWLNASIRRCRAERKVMYLRAAAIKACLNRTIRLYSDEEEFKSMLDPANANTAYRLGRLFATLEKIQEEANPNVNATIRDRYYGAASTSPVTVFTTLLRLKNHHIAKLENRSRATYFEKLIGEITSAVSDFPAHLALPDQGRLALGYYHQRQAFFSKAPSSDNP